MSDFNFGTASILELGNSVSEFLKSEGITEKAKMIIYVNENEFKKVDEDLFYRNKTSDDEEFVPSEGEIETNFDLIEIFIKQKMDE